MSAEEFARQIDVSRETIAKLDSYAALLRKWNPAINLVAKSTISELWTRHFLDSAQLLELMEPNATRWVDLGSGGGFPGLVVAVLAQELAPNLLVTCIESDGRKAAFLSTVVRELGLSAQVLSDRIEDISPLNADIVSARALAPLPDLLGLAHRHMAQNGIALLLKGEKAGAELKEALDTYRFTVTEYPSKTAPNAAVLSIGELRRV